MTSETSGPAGCPGESPAAAAEKIASEGQDIRERIRRLIVDTVRQRSVRLSELRSLFDDVMRGAVAGVREATPQRQDSALRQVIDGSVEAMEITANASRLAMEEAMSRGKAFVDEDVRAAGGDLKELGERFAEIAVDSAKKAGKLTVSQLDELRQHAVRAAKSAWPAVRSAVSASMKHPFNLATESAQAGAHFTRMTAGAFFSAMSGMLQAAADLATPKTAEKEDDE